MNNETESSQQQDERRKIKAKVEERRRWWEFRETARRCKEIAEQLWGDALKEADVTPVERVGLLKEIAATYLISADRRGLNATPEPKAVEETAPEAASGTDEASVDAEAVGLAEAGERIETAR